MKLHIEKAIYGGAGLARAEGKAVFVPGTLPGEEVEAAIRRDKGSFAEAALLDVLTPAPERVQAPCPYYGACGGCQYQHARYPAQLAMKRGILLETLTRASLADLPEIATHAGEPWGYRNRIRLHVDPASGALGYRRGGSHALLPVDHCPIAAPLLGSAIAPLLAAFSAQKAGAWCAEVELFTNESSSTLLLSFGQRAGSRLPSHALDKVCTTLKAELPPLQGAVLLAPEPPRSGRNQRSHKALADEPEGETAAGTELARWGEPSLTYRVGEHPYRVSAGAFFQGNRFLVDKLAELATESKPGTLAWDLFAGVGLFARMLATRFTKVVAVEGAPISQADLRHNLPDSPNKAVRSSTLDFLRRHSGPAPDHIILDPPRTGLGGEATALLARVHSQTITYVSCDPATLARDLAALVHAGYTVTALDLVDMFPQTFHLETVAKLRLR